MMVVVAVRHVIVIGLDGPWSSGAICGGLN